MILAIVITALLIYFWWQNKSRDLCPKCTYLYCFNRRTGMKKTKCSAYINHRGGS